MVGVYTMYALYHPSGSALSPIIVGGKKQKGSLFNFPRPSNMSNNPSSSSSSTPNTQAQPLTSKLAVIASQMNQFVREENAALSELVSRRNRYIAHLQEELHRSLELNENLQRSLIQFQEALMTLQRHGPRSSRFEIQVAGLQVPQVVEVLDEEETSTEEYTQTTLAASSQESTIVWENSPENPANYPEHPNYRGPRGR